MGPMRRRVTSGDAVFTGIVDFWGTRIDVVQTRHIPSPRRMEKYEDTDTTRDVRQKRPGSGW
jgi:hypothetical protein